MRRLLALLALAAAPAQAETLSQEIGRTGLAATEARLSALASPSASELFALGGLRFLGTVEDTLQDRWRLGLPEQLRAVPFLRLPIPENPAPAPFDPAAIAALFRAAGTGMEQARAPLLAIPDGAEVAVEIDLGDLWFDINANARRDAGEDLMDVAGPMVLGVRAGAQPAGPAPVIRFDTADAAWLAAYTHLLQGLSEILLAYDPTQALRDMADARAGMAAIGPPGPGAAQDDGLTAMIDAAYAILSAMQQAPDPALTAQARDNLLAMVAQNRRFWTLVAAETDDDREWLPNDAQSGSALGIVLPPGTGALWLKVLDDFEAILAGRLLVPYWRVSGGGLDVAAMFADPRPIDLPGWVQGAAALPYLKTGPVADGASWQSFADTMSGEAMLLTLFLN